MKTSMSKTKILITTLLSFVLTFLIYDISYSSESIEIKNSGLNKQNIENMLTYDQLDYINTKSLEFYICPEFIEAILEYEEDNRFHIINKKDDLEFYKNMNQGIEYILYLFETYEDPAIVLDMYKFGYCNTDDNFELSEYANNVLKRSEELERLHGK